MTRLCLLALLFFAVPAVAQDVDAGAPVGVLTKAPQLLKQVEAIFPSEMLDAGTGGTVAMEVDIGADGTVLEAKVTGSAGEAFDAAALSAVRQFLFSPAEVDGAPAPVRIAYSYTFFFKQEVVEAPVDVDAGVPLGLVNFSGRVVQRGTRDPLEAAQVIVGTGAEVLEALTDSDGRFELKDVPPGPQRVVVLAQACEKYVVEETFTPGQRTEATYYVRKKVYGAMETVVRTTRERKEVAQVTLKQEEIRLIPGTNGDAFRVVQNLPGVARAPFGIGLLIVRGSKPWDTKTYVDDTLVPVLFHFGGLYSTYNSYLLDSLSFQAGNFGASYGRGIGAMVSAEARTPSKKGLHGYFDINLVDSSALIEAPITDEWSFALSGRRSYIEVTLPTILGLIPGATDAISFTVAPRYFDYQARLEWKPKSGKKRFFVSLFGSNDRLVFALPNPSLDPEGRGEVGTSIVYNRLLFGFDAPVSERVDFRTRTSFGFDEAGFTAGADLYAKGNQYPVLSRNIFTVRAPELSLEVALGADLYFLPYTVDAQSPPTAAINQVPDPFVSRRLVTERITIFQFEPGVFADALWKPLDRLKLVAGVRADYNTQMKKGWVDPRLSAFFNVSDQVLLKGGAGVYHQPPDYRQGQLSATFGNPDLLPEAASQYMVGTEVKFTDAISLDVQLYYKDLYQQSRRAQAEGVGSNLAADTTVPKYNSRGLGRGYGAEILLRHALTKNFFGWVAYSLSRTERDFKGGKEWGLSPFDQTHNLIALASYKLPLDFIVGAKIRYTTGPLNTPFVGAIYDANGNYYYPIPGTAWSRRLPDFFQLDVRIDKRFVFRDWMLAVYCDIQNTTNRGNVEGVINNFDYTEEKYLTGLPIIPVLGVRGEF